MVKEEITMRRDIGMNTLLLFIAAVVIILVSTGCGESKKESAIGAGGSATGVAAVGFTECYKCHADTRNPASFPVAFGDTAAGSGGNDGNVPSTGPAWRTAWEGWLNGPHGNYESWNGTTFQKEDLAPANTGFPFYADFTDTTCVTCHDKLGQGKTIAQFYTSSGTDLIGTLDRPVIACESCHGGGGNHFGLGPMPYAKPNPAQCGECHNAAFPSNHLAYHPEGSGVVEAYNSSGHPQSINSHTLATAGTKDVVGKCARCHTDEGAKRFIQTIDGTMTYAEINTASAGLPNVVDANPVQCRTCHDGHNPLLMLGDRADAAAFPGGASVEFKTCTSCHQLLKSDGTRLDQAYHSPYDAAGTVVNSYGSAEEIIADTHYDDPATTAQIEGYVVNSAGTHDPLPGNTNRGICRDCHNPHNANLTINRQWARSAHGGEILEVKEAAVNVYTAAVGAGGDAWQHYNWDDRAGRGSCQVCHTATGIANFLNDPASYDLSGAGNDYSHLSGWTPAGSSGQNEMLYCWGCHTDNMGGLRNPGPIPIVYTYTPTSAGGFPTTTVNVTLPEARKTNVCLKCHGGRGNNDTILANVQDADFSLVDTVNRSTRGAEHHAPTAASLYAQALHSGYEYSGQDYTGAPAHAGIDVGASGRGPCVNCHLGGSAEAAASQKNHTFAAAEHDTGGSITTIVHQATCNTGACHNGGMSVAALQGKKGGFNAAYTVLDGLMKNTIVNYLNGGAGLDINTTANNNYKTIPVEAYGAFMNYKYMGEDPCAYVHNSRYTRRLLFDSIDWMQDGDLDGTIDLTAYPAAAVFLNGAAPASAVTRP